MNLIGYLECDFIVSCISYLVLLILYYIIVSVVLHELIRGAPSVIDAVCSSAFLVSDRSRFSLGYIILWVVQFEIERSIGL